MLPFTVPPGTTPRDYLLRVVPDAHRALVSGAPSDSRSREREPARTDASWDVSIALLGERPVRYRVDGDALTASEDYEPAHLVVALEKTAVARFLDDFAGPRRYVPKFEPRGAALITDPRVLSRLAMVTGSMEASLPDFEGGPVRIAIAAFGGKRGAFDPRDEKADVNVALPTRVFEHLLAGTLAPEAALGAGGVVLTGKKLVAMQLAFALAPFFPPPVR